MFLSPHIAKLDNEMSQYLKDLAHRKALSGGNGGGIAQAPTGTHRVRMRLVEASLDLVIDVARHYQSMGVDLSDLVGEGNLALTEAALSFNPYGPLSFQAFARVRVYQHLAHMAKQQIRESHPEVCMMTIASRNEADTRAPFFIMYEENSSDLPDIIFMNNPEGWRPPRSVEHNATLAPCLQRPRRSYRVPSRYKLDQCNGRGRWQHTQRHSLLSDERRSNSDASSEPVLLRFLQATGLRRDELKCLKVSDLKHYDAQIGRPAVKAQGQGGRTRIVPILPGCEQDVLTLVTSRADRELVFPHIPHHLDVHGYRREYAQALYLFLAPDRSLPPAVGHLPRNSYHRQAARIVTRALGHHRIEALTQYLRLKQA